MIQVPEHIQDVLLQEIGFATAADGERISLDQLVDIAHSLSDTMAKHPSLFSAPFPNTIGALKDFADQTTFGDEYALAEKILEAAAMHAEIKEEDFSED